MARPKTTDATIQVRVSADLLARVDAQRGDFSRSEWVRIAVASACDEWEGPKSVARVTATKAPTPRPVTGTPDLRRREVTPNFKGTK